VTALGVAAVWSWLKRPPKAVETRDALDRRRALRRERLRKLVPGSRRVPLSIDALTPTHHASHGAHRSRPVPQVLALGLGSTAWDDGMVSSSASSSPCD